jgi:DNA mismatch repair protein MutL
MNFSRELLTNNQTHSEQNTHLETSLDPRDTPLGRIIGQAHNSYIIVQSMDGIIFYDQHALAERIIYEKLLREDYGHNVQKLLIPEIIKLTSSEQNILTENKATFESMGFELEIIPGDSVMVQAIPDFIKKENLSSTIISIL